jgi:2',3'-cyclic-nucleotide 2'-phosphodiesterase (5'-nucleotidase family)
LRSLSRAASSLLLCAALAPAAVQHLRIVHTNDIHGALMPSTAFWMNRDYPPPLANAPGALLLIGELRAEAEAKGWGFLLLDGGDVFKGTPIGDFTRGQVVLDYFRRAGYDAVAVGNHDFDFGWEVLRELAEGSGLPWFATNLFVAGADTVPAWLRPSLVLERGGIKVGLLGLLTKYVRGMVSDSAFGPHEVVPYENVTRAAIADLRRQGADIIVALNHVGYSHDRRLADSLVGIDAIIGSHSHSGIEPAYEAPASHTIIQQAYSKLSTVGVLDLAVDRETRRVVGYESRLIDLQGEAVPMDLEYLAWLDSARARAEEGFDEVIGENRRELTRGGQAESPAGNFITDAMRAYARADIAVHNSAGIRATLPAGPIRYRDVYQVDIFGNTVVVGNYTGAQVREMLEVSVNGHHAIFQVSGLRMTYSPRAPIGQRVKAVTVGGEPLDPEKVYRVATNSFLASGTGEYGIFTRGTDIEDSYMPLRDVMVAHIRANSPLDVRIEGRIVVSDR